MVRRINAFTIDHLFYHFRLVSGREHAAVPSDSVERTPTTQIEHGHVPVDAQGKHGLAEQVGDHIVAGVTAHGPRELTRHNRGVHAIDEARCHVARSEDVRQPGNFALRQLARGNVRHERRVHLQFAIEISFDTLKEIYAGLKADVTGDPAKEAKAKRYLEHLNKAFKVMKIDTVEAQAVYLAHAFIESDQFRQFTETQGSINEGAQKWMDDPTQVQINKSDLKKRYALGGSVNPTGGFEFIGRGPVQVTHKAEYVEVIAMLEKTADQYEKDAKAGDAKAKEYADLARKAAKDIRADPRKAADPEYTFLVSAAFMKKRGADVSAATVKTGTPWTGADAASGWVAGGKQAAGSPQAKALVDKSNAYDKIYPLLMREANKKKSAAQTATP